MKAGYLLLLCLLGTALQAQQSGQSDEWDTLDWGDEQTQAEPWLHGFVEAGWGQRLRNDPVIERSTTLADLRVQLQSDYQFEAGRVQAKVDAYHDGVKHASYLAVRELYWQSSLAALGEWGEQLDIKLGQQVLSWGTGDYLFLNDLFPKNYQSFFSGRADPYLKDPSMAAKLSAYGRHVNLDVVVTPTFTPDTYINGDYFSFFSPLAGQQIAPGFKVQGANKPNQAEYAMRLYGTFGVSEWALYGYKGFTKSPQALDQQMQPRFARQYVLGGSLVRPLGKGLAKFEYAWQGAPQDSQGSDPLLPNAQHKWLVGYDRELWSNLNAGVQWYLESIRHHATLLANTPFLQYAPKQHRQVLTGQLRYQAWQQTLNFQLFNFYSPSDKDGYLKLRVDYSPGDSWQASLGANWFYGKRQHSFFAQFEQASNVYLAYRYFFSH